MPIYFKEWFITLISCGVKTQSIPSSIRYMQEAGICDVTLACVRPVNIQRAMAQCDQR